MGYIGQHLTSIVTGYPGGKSGARGYDLILSDKEHAEIKTCYRVDQLGSCLDCNAAVSSIEVICSECNSKNIKRNDDSKWLLTIRNDYEFAHILDPKYYYFVLFEFEELNSSVNRTIVASIWRVNPKSKGFGYCAIDYYLNIRPNSKSSAPFNMWPYQLKFYLTKPKLIYQSIIYSDDTIKTIIFPTLENTTYTILPKLDLFSRTTTLTINNLQAILFKINPRAIKKRRTKIQLLQEIEQLRQSKDISNDSLCDTFAEKIYYPLISPSIDKIPELLKDIYVEN